MKLSLALLLAVALAMALFRSCGQGLRSQRRWERVRVSRSLGPKRQVSNWPCSLGLSSCPSRLRLRLNTMVPMVPSESPKQQPVGTEQQPSELPDPLGQFWEYLAQGGRVWLLCDNWDAICLLGVGLLALGLWRTVQRHRRQATGRWASASAGTDRRGKDALYDYALLCRMEANTAFMVWYLRHLYQLRVQELGLPQPRKKALNKYRKGRAPWRTPGKFI